LKSIDARLEAVEQEMRVSLAHMAQAAITELREIREDISQYPAQYLKLVQKFPVQIAVLVSQVCEELDKILFHCSKCVRSDGVKQ
jgi:hypothetical protein